jgi:anti-sigma regulatory factor (Ser/Thr protein kinase)
VLPKSSSGPLLGLSLRCDRRASRLARRALEEKLTHAPVLDDARLVVSELINNAVLHSGCAEDDIIRVTAQLEDGYLIISVHEPGVANEARDLRPAEDRSQPGGFGLRIVQRLAHRWGSERPDGHRVWAALPAGAS